MINKFITACALTTIVYLLTSCTKEDTADCYSGLQLNFNFTLHNNKGNLFGPQVQQIKIYLFDQNGLLRAIKQDNGLHLTNDYVMNIDIAPGKYTVIAWGGSNEDFTNSYIEAHMNDPVTHNYTEGVTIGQTHLNDFRVMLKYGIANDYPEDIMPTINEFDDLFYGAVGTRAAQTSKYVFEQVEIKAGKITSRDIELIKNTNTLKVTISGLEYLQHYNPNNYLAKTRSSDILQVWVSARNGRYKFDNTIGEYSRLMRYFPQYKSLDANKMLVDIKIMRLDIERHTAEPMYLTIQNPVTGTTYPSYPIDIVNSLLQAKDPNTGEYIYQNQEDFDREDEHPIEIRINSNLSVSIIIKDWEIITLKPEI